MTFTIVSKKYGSFDVLIDDEDWDKVKEYKWHIKKYVNSFYAAKNTDDNTLLIHRFIMNCPDGMIVDHINHNTLDNRKENLRICTKQQNNMNARKSNKFNSSFKGVKLNGKGYQSRIQFNYKRINIGTFKTELEAGRAYDIKAKELHGQYAQLNNA